MTAEESFEKRYRNGDTPWDVGRPDFNLIEVVTQTPIAACKALDVGCGTGDNSIWLARNRFQVTGTDISEIAIKTANEKAAGAGVGCDFRVLDFINDNIGEVSFDFVFDRGCFHSFDSEKERSKFASNAASCLNEGGLWLSLIGNADEHRQDSGPPRRTAGDIVTAVEPFFEIVLLASSRFESNRPNPSRAWRCLMRKRQDERFST